MPQLTLRSAVTGFCLGGVLSITNLYVAAKTGAGPWAWDSPGVILAFAIYRAFARFGARDMTILENNCVQSIATAAGYMTLRSTSGLAAYMWATNACCRRGRSSASPSCCRSWACWWRSR